MDKKHTKALSLLVDCSPQYYVCESFDSNSNIANIPSSRSRHYFNRHNI